MSSQDENGEIEQDSDHDVSNATTADLSHEAEQEDFDDYAQVEDLDGPGPAHEEDQELVDAVLALDNGANEGADVLTQGEPEIMVTRTSPGKQVRRELNEDSIDDSASTPDDAPSILDSGRSSPGSGFSVPAPTLPRKGSVATKRPFELRFQSRLSSSYTSSVRPGSPAFLTPHSRNISISSFDPPSESAQDDTPTPWQVIRWTRLKRLTGQAFSEIGRRNFGSPTCIAVTDQIVIGTSRGLVLLFDHHQVNKALIGPGTRAAEAGAVTSLAISADHTAVAAGHATGEVFVWELARPARPFLHIPAIDVSLAQARKRDGHVKNSAVLHIGFLGYRRTALVSADDKGMAFSHLATRGTGAVLRSVKTARILGRYPDVIVRATEKPAKKSSVLALATLPLGNVEQGTDTLGLTAMLTPYLLVVVSTTPLAQTQHKSPRPKEVAAHSAVTGALAWFPAIKLRGSQAEISRNKLAYAWSNLLTILEIDELPREPDAPEDKPVDLQFLPRSRYLSEEAIVAIQWLSRSVMAILTITQQLLIIEDHTMIMTDSFDLLPKNLYHADLFSNQLADVVENFDEDDESAMHGVVADGYFMSFKAYKARLFLLGNSDIWWGTLTNWADRLLAMMESGDFIGAVRLATSYYSGIGEKVTIGLPEDNQARMLLVQDKLLDLMSASLRHVFGKNEMANKTIVPRSQLVDLAVACISACLELDDQDFMFEEIFSWYDDNGLGDIFVDVLEPHILDREVTALPPAAVKTLVNHFSQIYSPSRLEEIICLLDATTMDIDQVTTLCRQYNLYDAYIYVWNTALSDYSTPLLELLKLTEGQLVSDAHGSSGSGSNMPAAEKMFPYLSFVLTSRIYPLGELMDEERSSTAKSQLYEALFYGRSSQTNSFDTLKRILRFDVASFMAALNEAFEDPYLGSSFDNEQTDGRRGGSIYNRQTIVHILLDVMSKDFPPEDVLYLNMFIARNLPKYPQDMLLSGTVLEQIFISLCHANDEVLKEDVQLSLEYLLSVYRPPNLIDMVPTLQEAGFFKILKNIYKQEHRWSDLVRVYLDDQEDQQQVFEVIFECLRERSTLTNGQKDDLRNTLRQSVSKLAIVDATALARITDRVQPDEHSIYLQRLSDEPSLCFRYLRALLEPEYVSKHHQINHDMVEQYLRLMCRFDPENIVVYINSLDNVDLQLGKVLPSLEEYGNVDAAVTLLARQSQVREAMDRLVKHFSMLETALDSIHQRPESPSDEARSGETILDLLASIDKYASVGLWLCQYRSKSDATVTISPRRASTNRALTPEEQIWLDFLVAVVSILQTINPTTRNQSASTISDTDVITTRLRTTVQSVFTSLLAATSTSNSNSTVSFLPILQAFLTSISTTSPSLSHLRHILTSIFSAYVYEESLLSISNSMLDKDLFVDVSEINKLRVSGWRPRGQVCNLCKRRVWGPGAGEKIYTAWQKSERQRDKRRRALRGLSEDEEDEVSSVGRDKNRSRRSSKGKERSRDVTPDSEENYGSDEDDENRPLGSLVISNGRRRDGSANRHESAAPIVAFACRHIYHKPCLEHEISGTTGMKLDGAREDDEQSLGSYHDSIASDGNINGTEGGQRLVCPLCAHSGVKGEDRANGTNIDK